MRRWRPTARRLLPWIRLWLVVSVIALIGSTWLFVHNPDFTFTFNAPKGATTAPVSGYGFATSLTNLSDADLNQRLSDMKATGVTWLRFDLSWAVVQPDSAKTYDWSSYDRIVRAATSHGFKVLMIVDFAPAWARAAGCSDGQICRPADPVAYGRFAGAAAAHYKGMGVHDWEIWNEPNIAYRFEPGVDPAFYVRMLKDADAAIKRADRQAVVLAGCTSPSASNGTGYAPVDFVRALYANGAAGWFDAISAHPYTAPISPAQSRSSDAWGQLAGVHDIMAAHGDGAKQIWVTEFGAATDGPDPNHVTEAFQAQMISDAIGLWRTYSWAGPLFVYDYADAGTDTSTSEDFYGLVRADGSHKPAYDALVSAIAGATGSQ